MYNVNEKEIEAMLIELVNKDGQGELVAKTLEQHFSPAECGEIKYGFVIKQNDRAFKITIERVK